MDLAIPGPARVTVAASLTGGEGVALGCAVQVAVALVVMTSRGLTPGVTGQVTVIRAVSAE